MSFHRQDQRQQQIASLFDHFDGASDERRRHNESERLGGLEIDDEIGAPLDPAKLADPLHKSGGCDLQGDVR